MSSSIHNPGIGGFSEFYSCLEFRASYSYGVDISVSWTIINTTPVGDKKMFKTFNHHIFYCQDN